MTAAYPPLRLFIDGAWSGPDHARAETVVNPSTEVSLGAAANADKSDVDAAIESAVRGFEYWRRVPAYERSKLLRRTADILRERAEQYAYWVTLELGKPIADSRNDVEAAAGQFEWAAEECRRAYGRVIPARARNVRQWVLREPVGPVAAFTTWNSPILTPSRKIATALAAGCSVIIKPSGETPAGTQAVVEALQSAGLPRGVINLVTGYSGLIAEQLLRSPAIRGMTFTGSTAIGKRVAALAVEGMKRMVLELGGYAPVVICSDVDVEHAAAAAVTGKFRNSGQVCTSPTRFIVHESIHDRFVDAFAKLAKQIKVGDPMNPDTKMGPLANERRARAIDHMVSDARSRGIRVATGGERLGSRGFYYAPTLLSGIDNDCIAANEEPFGPLGATTPFATIDEAISIANRLPFGLAAYVMTNDARQAEELTDGIESGNVIINHWQIALAETPFGGHKDSGLASEGGMEGLAAFQNVKFVSHSR
jgi:succinate-semialdehyde dehydrogenase / glutarate-semialdehyde dehydrogenase